MSQAYDRKGNLVSRIEEAFSLHVLGKKSQFPARIARLGIPEEELTETVSLVLSALLEKTDDLQLELEQTRNQLKEIESLVDVDCVAPIPNRRAFMRRLQWVIAMQERYGHPSSIIFFDLNRFKEINDTYGHAAGDMAIRHVSEILMQVTRESDFLARIGGDEFAIILYYATAIDAQKRAEHIADRIRRTPFLFNGKSLHVDTAVGCHAIRKGETPDDALSHADHSMYENKRHLKTIATEIRV